MILVLRDAGLRAPKPQRGHSRQGTRKLSLTWSMPSFSANLMWFWPLLLLAMVILGWQKSDLLLSYIDSPITRVRIEGDLAYVGREAVQNSVTPYAQTQFFSADVAALRQGLEQAPWIASAEVRKIWPDLLVIRLTEQLPVARWGDNALLSSQGRAFTPDDVGRYTHLPRLWGPQHSQQKVMQHYQIFSQLLRPLNFTVASLEMREQGSWYLVTGQGFELLLGRDRVIDRVRRFIKIYELTLRDQITNVARVDLRYPNGLAIGWRAPPVANGEQGAVR